MRLGPVVFLIVFCAVIGAVIWITHLVDGRSTKSRQRYLEQGICVEGVVRRVDHITMARPNYWAINARYEVDGVAYYVSSDRLMSRPPYEVGDAINVYCNPDDPADNRILDIDVM